MKYLLSLAMASIFTACYSSEPAYVQVVNPLSVQDAVKWDYFVQMIPLKDASIILDTKSARGTTQILQSYTVVYINDKPNVLLTYLRPREGIQQVISDQIQLEELEKKLRERAKSPEAAK